MLVFCITCYLPERSLEPNIFLKPRSKSLGFENQLKWSELFSEVPFSTQFRKMGDC